MCDLTTALIAMNVAGAGMQIRQNRMMVESQIAARKIAQGEAARSMGEINKRQLQEQAAAAQQIEQIEREAMRAMGGQAASTAMQQGAGASYEAVIQEIAVQASEAKVATERNLEFTLDALQGEKKGIAANFEMQPGIMSQGLLAEALQIGDAALSGYAQGESVK